MSVNRIVFLCGCLEPGKDGVGDYTRRLSEKLSGFGVHSLLIALADPFIHNGKIQKQGSEKVQIIRYSKFKTQNDVFKAAASEITVFNPEWVSIQFVPFAYSEKGIPFGIGKKMADLCRDRLVQIMFHELWLGMEINPELKYALWGRIQRMVFLDLLKRLNPECIHTHSDWYLSNLKKLGFKVEKLPLFSNIPLPAVFTRRRNYSGITSIQDKTIRFLIFGHISTGAPVEEFVSELKNIAVRHQINCTLTCCGKNSGELERWKTAWQNAGFSTSVRGLMDESEISKLIGESDIGIATTPLAVIEKSGSFMALMEHGLPVINVAEQKKLDKSYPFQIPEGLHVYKPGNLYELLEHAIRPEQGEKSGVVAGLFLKSLQNAESKGGSVV